MTVWAVIPVKDPATAKTRLAGALEPAAREKLGGAMAAHVAKAALAAPNIAQLCIAGTLPPGVAAEHLADTVPGLNPALQAALDHVAAQGATRLVVIAADLPQVTANDIALLAAAPSGEVAIAPDRHGTGTNALSLPLPAARGFQFAFGHDSFARHHAEADRLGLAIETIHSNGLARDIDEPADLADAAALLG